VIFVVDANDPERLGAAREELQGILAEDVLHGAPVLVYANKQDLPHAVTASALIDALGLHGTRGHEWHVQVRIDHGS
jgi:ADP-ribosylation factor protein 1